MSCSTAYACFIHSLISIVYVLLYLIPSSTQITLLVIYHSDIEIVKWILVTSSSLIIALTLFASTKLTMDLFKGDTKYDQTCSCCFGTSCHVSCNSDALCFNFLFINGFRSGCFWITFMLIWFICNVVSLAYFTEQLISNGSFWLYFLVFAPVLCTIFGVLVGYIIRKTCYC
jgi:hypothetical protein